MDALEAVRQLLDEVSVTFCERDQKDDSSQKVTGNEYRTLCFLYARLAELRAERAETRTSDRSRLSGGVALEELKEINSALWDAGFRGPVGLARVREAIRLYGVKEIERYKIDQALTDAGFEYPLGLNGVQDVIRMYKEHVTEMNATAGEAVEAVKARRHVGSDAATHRPGQVLRDREGDHWYVCGYDGRGGTLLAETKTDDGGFFRAGTMSYHAFSWHRVELDYGPLVWTENEFVKGFGLPVTSNV